MTQIRQFIRTKAMVALFIARLVRVAMIYLWCKALDAVKHGLLGVIQYLGSEGAREDLKAVAQGIIGGVIYTALTTTWNPVILVPFVVGFIMLRVARRG